MQLNRNNFLRWKNATAGPAPLPRPYELEPDYCAPALVLFPGEQYWAYVNADLPFATPLNLNLVNATVNSPLTFQTYRFAIDGGASHHTLISFGLPGNPPAPGTYLIRWSCSAGTVDSNPVEVMADATERDTFTALVKFRHGKALDNVLYPYAYEQVPAFRQTYRLRLNLRSETPFTQRNAYRATTTGETRPLQGSADLRVVLETPEYSPGDHRAAWLLSLHDFITINGVDYQPNVEASYSQAENPGRSVSDGSFGLIETLSNILITT